MSKAVLGLSAFYHDSAACLVVDGELVAAAQEERFSRKKHDHRFPVNAVEPIASAEAGIEGRPTSTHVVFYDKPCFRSSNACLKPISTTLRLGHAARFWQAMPLWLKAKALDARADRAGSWASTGDRSSSPEHHEIARRQRPSSLRRTESAAILTIDGVGEWATSSYWGVGQRTTASTCSRRNCTSRTRLGLLYSAFTYYTGFRVNSGEYKVMGLAHRTASRSTHRRSSTR